jgi:tripeptide aminopeptidase
MLKDSSVEHGPVRLLFTCDEEIGRGISHVDLGALGAAVAYTLDGEGHGKIDAETFSADLATITVRGVNTHPSEGKGRMVNAIRIAADFVARMPRQRMSPEMTDGRDGFMHPYVIEGGVAEVTIKTLLRDFETPALAEQAKLLESIAVALRAEHPRAAIDVSVKKQYRNMRDGLVKEPRAVAFAQEAMRRAGIEPKLTIIRGGTDGSGLTEKGLPTPNLSTGEHNPHSPLEWTCVEEIDMAANVLVELARVWAEKS